MRPAPHRGGKHPAAVFAAHVVKPLPTSPEQTRTRTTHKKNHVRGLCNATWPGPSLSTTMETCYTGGKESEKGNKATQDQTKIDITLHEGFPSDRCLRFLSRLWLFLVVFAFLVFIRRFA